jgi:PAS domain S-box-containing protein
VTLFTLAIFVISVLSLAFYSSHVLRLNMERQLGHQQLSTATIVAAHINQSIADRFRGLESLAASLDESLLSKPEAVQKIVEQRLLLKDLFNAGVFVTRSDGVAIAEAPRIGRIGLNYLDRDHIAAAITEGKATIGRPVIGKKITAPSFAMTVPIRNAHGAVIGALAGATDLSKPSFLDITSDSRYGRGGGYLIVDPAHKLIVTATYKERVMQALPVPGVNPVLDRRQQGWHGTALNTSSQGTHVLTSSSAIPAAGWFLIAALPAAEAFAPIHEVERQVMLAAILLTLAAGGLTWWMLRRQLAPMMATVETLAGMAHAQETPPPLPVVREDEIGALVSAFNVLLENLRTRETALRGEIEKNRALLRNASDGITIMDRDGNLLEFSDSFCAMLGYRREEMAGMNVSGWDCGFDGSDALNAALQRQFACPTRSEFQTRHRRKDGSTFDVEVSGLPLELDGKPVLFNTSRDISARKAAETEIRLLNAELEHRVAERTATLDATVRNLTTEVAERKQAEQALRMANRELESFSYSVAHDLRTPLRGISSFARLLEMGNGDDPDGDGKEALRRIQVAAQKMGDLIDNLLELSRLARQELAIEPVDLGALARAAVDELRAAEPDRRVLFEIPPRLEALCDRRLLETLLANLLGNAWKFTSKQADARIEIGVTEQAGIKAYYVRDNGAGFDTSHAADLFRPFHRLHDEKDFPGTGIGLAIVQRIVQRHGGRIWVEAAVGQGAAFHFTLQPGEPAAGH